MQQELEGKAYVENYIHSMAHEMKSPLTGIQGAAELLDLKPTTLEARMKKLGIERRR